MANNAPSTAIPLLLTRPRPASETFLAALKPDIRDRVRPIFAPLIDIVRLGAQVDMTPQDAAIFTSVNGVAAAPEGSGRAAYCIGPATTRAALDRGWAAVQSGANADALVAALSQVRPVQRLCHLSGVHTRGDIAQRLGQSGLAVHTVALYDQRLCTLPDAATQAIAAADRVIVPLFSPRTAMQFSKVAPQGALYEVIALSPAVAEALGAVPLARVVIAPRPDAQAMGAALSDLVRRN